MRAWIFRLWVWFALKVGVYYWWSKVYQRYTGWPYRKCGPLPKYDRLEDLERFLGSIKWEKDGLLALYDAIDSPKATYWKWVLRVDDRGLMGRDCDDIALLAADRIKDMALRGVLACLGVHARFVYLLTVIWRAGGKAAGHNVCLYRYVEPDGSIRWAHVGNWNAGRSVTGFVAPENAVRDVLRGAGADECVGWAMATLDLKLVCYNDGKGML